MALILNNHRNQLGYTWNCEKQILFEHAWHDTSQMKFVLDTLKGHTNSGQWLDGANYRMAGGVSKADGHPTGWKECLTTHRDQWAGPTH